MRIANTLQGGGPEVEAIKQRKLEEQKNAERVMAYQREKTKKYLMREGAKEEKAKVASRIQSLKGEAHCERTKVNKYIFDLTLPCMICST